MASETNVTNGIAITIITYPPIAYIYKLQIIYFLCFKNPKSILYIVMIIDKLEKEILGTIKSHRFKTVKTTNKHPTGIYVTKIMTFSGKQVPIWLEHEINERVYIIHEIQRTGYIHIQLNEIFETFIQKQSDVTSIYLTKRYVAGFSLADILKRKDQLKIITQPRQVKQIIWEMLALLVNGGGFNNLIVTNQNLVFQISGTEGFKPTLNFLSFVGFRFIHFKQEIQRDQYSQTAIFYDKDAYETNNINRIEFKARNFAILVLTLACGRDIATYVLEGLHIPPVISFQTAKQYHLMHIQPKLQKLVSYKSVQDKIAALQVPGLLEFIKTAFNLTGKTDLNWARVKMMLQKQISKNQKFVQIAKQFWKNEDEEQKNMLRSQGLQFVEDSPFVYLALKVGMSLQNLLKSNDWDQFFKDQKFNRWKGQLWHRLLSIYQKIQNRNQKNLTHFVEFGHKILQHAQDIQQKQVVFLSHEKKTLLAYPV